MATDTHIKFDGVDGESAHKDHKGLPDLAELQGRKDLKGLQEVQTLAEQPTT